MTKILFTFLLIVGSINPASTGKGAFLEKAPPCIINTESLVGEEAVRYVFDRSEFSGITDFVVAQAKFESYNFRSGLYIKNHNFVGMGVSYKRPQNRIGINRQGERGRPTAIYASDYDCAMDLLSWYRLHGSHFCEVDSPELFVSKLKIKNYFGAPEKVYLKGVKRWLSEQEAKAYWIDDIS